jgi:hypothetical protein
LARQERDRLAKGVEKMKRIFAMLGSVAAVFLAAGAGIKW